jgi:hypothetical protein
MCHWHGVYKPQAVCYVWYDDYTIYYYIIIYLPERGRITARAPLPHNCLRSRNATKILVGTTPISQKKFKSDSDSDSATSKNFNSDSDSDSATSEIFNSDSDSDSATSKNFNSDSDSDSGLKTESTPFQTPSDRSRSSSDHNAVEIAVGRSFNFVESSGGI